MSTRTLSSNSMHTRHATHRYLQNMQKTESPAFMNRIPYNPDKYISMWPCHFQRCKYAFQMDITISRTQFQRNCIYIAVLLNSKFCNSPKLALDSLRVYKASIFTDRRYLPSILRNSTSSPRKHHPFQKISGPEVLNHEHCCSG